MQTDIYRSPFLLSLLLLLLSSSRQQRSSDCTAPPPASFAPFSRPFTEGFTLRYITLRYVTLVPRCIHLFILFTAVCLPAKMEMV